MPGSFLDSNVVLYVASNDAAKADRAEALLAAGGTISVQVLNEVANVARRKMRMSWAETRALLATLEGLVTVRDLTRDIHHAGIGLAERYGLSIYDAMIVASALDAGCNTLWSEDMQDGLAVQGGLRIADPFGTAGMRAP